MSFTSNCGLFSSMTNAQVSSMSSPMSVSKITGIFSAARTQSSSRCCEVFITREISRRISLRRISFFFSVISWKKTESPSSAG